MAGEVMPQEDIERLLCGMSGTPPSQSDENSKQEKTMNEILSKDELNALFGGNPDAISLPDESNKKKPTDEVLSANEVENLLNMMCPINAPKSKENKESVTSERIDMKQMKTLQLMHQKFERRFTAKVCTMLQACVDIRLISIDQLAYCEFVFACDNPTCFNLIQVKTPDTDENMFLDVNPSVCYPVIERMLGGGREEPTINARRSLTKIETRLIQQVIDVFLKELKTTWQKIVELEFTVEQTESNPQLIQCVEPNEEVVVMCFEVSFVEIKGTMTLCIPVDVLNRLISRSDHEDAVMEVFRKTCGSKNKE